MNINPEKIKELVLAYSELDEEYQNRLLKEAYKLQLMQTQKKQIIKGNAKYSTDRDWIYNRQLNKTLVHISEEQCFIKEHLIEYLSNTDYNKAENGNWIITDIKKEQ